MLTILDYGVGNLGSIFNMFKRVGAKPVVTGKIDDLERATKIVLPGVGSFDRAVESLDKSGLRECLEQKVVVEKVPVLGMCVGMQMLGHGSEEGILPGLGWIDSRCVKFDVVEQGLRVPHMGWNAVFAEKQSPLTEQLNASSRFYFVHSYHMVCNDPADILMTADYGGRFIAAVQRGNIFGTQFHPEKSHKHGMDLYRQFISL